jgi:hypothetical protein
MSKKLRKSLWGLQWIFLRHEKPSTRTSLKKSFDISAIENSVASDIDDFPELSMLKLEDYDFPPIEINSVSTKEKYKMSHIEDMPNLNYKNPHIHISNKNKENNESKKLGSTRHHSMQQTFELKEVEKVKPTRNKSIQIRKVVFPPKGIIRERRLESVNSTSKRKNYGRWFLPPEKWKESLNSFLNSN